MRSIIIGILLVSTIIFGNSTAYSQCGSCIYDYFSVYDEFKGSNAVFSGKVVEIKKVEESKNTDTTTNTDYYEFKVKFKVETAWKTDLPETITIINTDSKNSHFKLGESYLVYAYVLHYDNKNLRAHIGCCTRTKLLSEAEEDLREFKNKGEKPTNIIKASPKDNDKPNKSMDVRRKQRLCYQLVFLP
jgi:hypothetical protein